MFGKIKSIEEVDNLKLHGCDYMDGYKIVTDKHTFLILIYGCQSCCEDFGYISSEDTFDNFIGAEVTQLRTTDTNCTGKILDFFKEQRLENADTQFLDFVTNKGVLQFVVYNEHNGSYGHDILVTKDEEIIVKNEL